MYISVLWLLRGAVCSIRVFLIKTLNIQFKTIVFHKTNKTMFYSIIALIWIFNQNQGSSLLFLLKIYDFSIYVFENIDFEKNIRVLP